MVACGWARFWLPRMGPPAVCAAALVLAYAPVHAQDTSDLSTPTGSRPVQLWPPPGGKTGNQKPPSYFKWGGWTYRAYKSPNPRNGVPWELVATPTGEDAGSWHKGGDGALPRVAVQCRSSSGTRRQDTVPVVEIPQVLWKRWMAPDLQDVVGIHFHELVSDDVARILFSLHRVPPDEPDGTLPAGSDAGRSGTRIEATLLAPVVYCLDQTILVRKDPLHKELAAGRAQHEAGHALVSQAVLLDALRGEQDWNLQDCIGRRCRLAYYWKRERIGRTWDGYRNQAEEVLTLRTSIVLVPPTRWSLLLPIPPERVTQKHIQAFNESIVHPRPRFVEADRRAQARFHAHHGAYEAAALP